MEKSYRTEPPESEGRRRSLFDEDEVQKGKINDSIAGSLTSAEEATLREGYIKVS